MATNNKNRSRNRSQFSQMKNDNYTLTNSHCKLLQPSPLPVGVVLEIINILTGKWVEDGDSARELRLYS